MSEFENKASKTQSSYDEIFEQIGNGPFQTRFLIFTVALTSLVSMQFMTKIIIVTVPDHWCHVPGREATNYTLAEWKALTIPRVYDNGINRYSKCTRFLNEAKNATLNCDHGWEYDHTWYDMTASMQNNLVCDDHMIPTHVLALSRAADMIGTLLLGHLADHYGRKPLFYVSLIIILVGRIAVVFTSSWMHLFMFFSCIGSLANNTISICVLVIAMEISGPNQRAFTGMIAGYGWGVGVVVSPLIMWWRRDWTSYCLITTIPCCIFLFLDRTLPKKMDFFSPNDIKLLSDLLSPQKGDESSDDDDDPIAKKSTNTYLSPADIQKKSPAKPTAEQEIKKSPYEKTEEAKKSSILDYEDECLEKVDEFMDECTWKTTPTWDISYRQAVSASDVFLQMGNKTPATASCENMILKINLPGEVYRSIDLKITEREVKLNSAKYFVKVPLPQSVDPQLGDAKFDHDTDTLTVTLVMDREFDFVNY